MIAVSRFPRFSAIEPVRVCVGLTRAELAGLKAGRQTALAGRDLGLEGTDFLFLATTKGQAHAEALLKTLIDRFRPPVPQDHRFPVVFLDGKLWHLPLQWRPTDVAQITAFARAGVGDLEAGETLTYRQRLFGAGVIPLPEGVHAQPVTERVVRRAFRRGESLLPGSVQVFVRLAATQDAAVAWARRKAGIDPKRPPTEADDAAEVQPVNPPDWLPHWPVTRTGRPETGSRGASPRPARASSVPS